MTEDSWARERAKELRRERGGEDPRLERRRFLLPDSPELRERLKTIKKVFAEVQASHPELIALNFYGSYTKGYAADTSDIDICVALAHGIGGWDVVKILKQRLCETLNLPPEKISLSPYEVGGPNVVEDGVQARLFMLSIGKGIYELRKRFIDKLESADAVVKGEGDLQWNIAMTFLWHTETKGFPMEVRKKRKALYPWTLAEAREYFLRGRPKTMSEF